MTHRHDVDSDSRARRRNALLAVGMALGLGTGATLAAWTDAMWANGVFDLDPDWNPPLFLFQLQSAPSPDAFESQADHPLEAAPMARMAALDTQQPDEITVSATVVLTPGRDAFLPIYLRTSEDSEPDALVSVSEAHNGKGDTAATPAVIWGDQNSPGFVTYGARIQQFDESAPTPECSIDTFDALNTSSDRLFGTASDATSQHDGLVPMTAGASDTQFTLAGQAENMYLVCFRFHLDPAVIAEAPDANGAPFQPSWTFTGEAIDQ